MHSGKDFVVSAGLNRVVSVRTSRITPDRRYPRRSYEVGAPTVTSGLLPFYEIAHVRHLITNVRTFLTNLAHRKWLQD